MNKVLITGGGGFVGFAVLKKILAENIEAVVIGRHQYPEVEKLGVEVRRGDIRDGSFIERASRDCDLVFHVAAKAGIWGRREDYFSINLCGTENVINACLKNNIEHLVYTSTPSVVFSGKDIEGADESIGHGTKFLCHYAASKSAAEKKVLAANSVNLRTVALRPHLVWGPGDTNLIPRLVERGRKGLLKQVGDGSNLVDISYIDNVADAHYLAAVDLEGKGRAAGKAYFISQGEPVNLWEWINGFLARLQIPPVEKKIDFNSAYFVGSILEFAYKILGKHSEPLMTRFLAEQLAKSHWFSLKAAKKDFGYCPSVATDAGIDKTIEWLRHAGIS